jgi:flagellar motor switch protein FliN/FliY
MFSRLPSGATSQPDEAEGPIEGPDNERAEIVHAGDGAPLVSLESAILRNVNVTLKVRLGELSLSVQELLALRAGSVVKLGAQLNDLVELRLNDQVVARGEVVAVGDNFGVRIVEVAEAG